MKKLISLISAALLAAATVPAQANLMNGDFSDGWTGWIGDDFAFGPFDPPDSDGLGLFTLCNGQISAGGGGTGAGNCSPSGGSPGQNFARIDPSPSFTGVAALVQEFTVPLGARTLSFDYLWAPSDPINDMISFGIFDPATGILLDLFAGLTNAQIVGGPNTRVVDISSFAGSDVFLTVGGMDGNLPPPDIDPLYGPDIIDVDNFQVRIPEPAALFLTGLGLAGIGAFRRRQRA